MTRDTGFFVEGAGEAFETGEIGIRVRLVLLLDRMLIVEEGRDVAVESGQLAEHIRCACTARPEIVASVRIFTGPETVENDIVARQVIARERAPIESREPRQLARVQRLALVDAGERGIVDLAALVGALAGVDTKTGSECRREIDVLVHEAVEQLVESRAARSRISGKAGDRDQCERGSTRFQNGTAVEHGDPLRSLFVT